MCWENIIKQKKKSKALKKSPGICYMNKVNISSKKYNGDGVEITIDSDGILLSEKDIKGGLNYTNLRVDPVKYISGR